jgi:hypothetical protein
MEAMEVERAVHHAPRQIAQIAQLLRTDAGTSQLIVADCGQPCRRGRPGIEERLDAALDRGSRFRRELLRDDGVHEGTKRILMLGISKTAGAVLADEIAKHGIAPRQGALRLPVIDDHVATIASHAFRSAYTAGDGGAIISVRLR